MNILVIGDSFAADWSVKYNVSGWPNLLAKEHKVTNLAQAGISQYKIYKQICSVKVEDYDLVIVSHTSPYRVHTRQHPVHSKDLLHRNADLIYNDILYHLNTFKGWFNRRLRSAYRYFTDHYDIPYQEDIYKLLRKATNDCIKDVPYIVVTNFSTLKEFKTEQHVLDISDICLKYPGKANHMSDEGNALTYKLIKDKICSITSK